MKSNIKKILNIFQALLLIVVPVFVFSNRTSAALLTQRSVTVSSSTPSSQVSESFGFSVPTTTTIGSIEFEHCSNSPLNNVACVAPVGLSLSAATLSAQSNNTGFTIDLINSTVNRIILTRIASNGTLGLSTYAFSGITNPSAAGQTYFVRIATYASTDATGPRGDTGSVAYSTNGNFSVGAYVPPFLIFCAAVIVALDCSSDSGLLISFGELSPTQTKSSTSQYSGATNDPTGFSVFLSGETMTAGNQAITAMAANSATVAGTGQFGINLRGNTSPVVGADRSGGGSLAAVAAYDTPNSYRFVDGEKLAGTAISTDFTKYTVSYVVNIPLSQPPGYYATTLTYVAVASF